MTNRRDIKQFGHPEIIPSLKVTKPGPCASLIFFANKGNGQIGSIQCQTRKPDLMLQFHDGTNTIFQVVEERKENNMSVPCIDESRWKMVVRKSVENLLATEHRPPITTEAPSVPLGVTSPRSKKLTSIGNSHMKTLNLRPFKIEFHLHQFRLEH